MSFGLSNAAQTFQRFINNSVLRGIQVVNSDGDITEGSDFYTVT